MISYLLGNYLVEEGIMTKEQLAHAIEMQEKIRVKLNFTTLRYHRLDDMIESVGIPREKLCTYCWNGKE